MFCSYDCYRHLDSKNPPKTNSGIKVTTDKYGSFQVVMLGDSYFGTISKEPKIQFDCGSLAGIYANENYGKREGRCIVSKNEERVAATIIKPPYGKKSEYYPINVFSPNQNVNEEELKIIAFQIETQVLSQ